ncbi:hypothetical protein FQN54_009427 [Arachnomyces sp. PD_36]|nr:hypothetical protein FQN54_009427 [Arachnomyces sp. PD_36]
MLNDTDSDMQTVFHTDLATLGVALNYMRYGLSAVVQTTAGQMPRVSIQFEIQLLTAQGAIAST